MAINTRCSSATTTKQDLPRRLSELLKEKQEPFVLEIYLLERGCKSTTNNNKISCSTNQPSKNSSTSKVSSHNHGRDTSSSKNSTQISSFARSLLNKMVFRPKSGRKSRTRREEKEKAETTCSTFSNFWSESTDTDAESFTSSAHNATITATRNHGFVADRVMSRWSFVDENKQSSPDSVLDEIDLLQSIPVYDLRREQETPTTSRIRFQRNVSDESILSTSLWEMLVMSRTEKPRKVVSQQPYHYPQYMSSKKALQQRQLLFDCVREVVESNNGSNVDQQRISREKGLIIGPEEIGKMLCKNLTAWGKFSAGDTSVKKLIRMDLLGFDEGWGGLEPWKREIAIEIGNGIFDEMIDDTVRDIFDQD